MSIYYNLYENKLREEIVFAARVQPVRSVDLEGVIDRMMQHGSTITLPTCWACWRIITWPSSSCC